MLGVNGYISRRQNGTIGYLFKDAHGDVLAAFSATTTKVADYSYDAWGKPMSTNETSSFSNNPLRYCGEYYDTESGMTYLRARYYDNSIRRFITEDPAKDGLNWYAYCGSNPVNKWDQFGLYSSPFNDLMIATMNLVNNKILYSNYMTDYESYRTSYAAPQYTGTDSQDRDDYYNGKFNAIHSWANNERNKIRENTYLNDNPQLKELMMNVIDLQGGGSIEEVSAAIYNIPICSCYCKFRIIYHTKLYMIPIAEFWRTTQCMFILLHPRKELIWKIK